MPRLLLIALLALSGCVLRRGMRNTVAGGGEGTAVIVTGGGMIVTGPLIVIDENGGLLCDPDDADPQHTCP